MTDNLSLPPLPAPFPIGRHIILVGMMGVGKSSLGRRLSRRLQLALADSDREIERAAGMGIGELFRLYGEPELRALERRVMTRLLAMPPQIIATGGDAFTDAETRELLKAGGLTIWLKASAATLTARIRRLEHRPLLNAPDIPAQIAELVEARAAHYGEARLTLETDEQPVPQIIERIVDLLRAELRG